MKQQKHEQADADAKLQASEAEVGRLKEIVARTTGMLGPRTITNRQKNRFREAVAGEPRGPIVMNVCIATKEAANYGTDVDALLKEARYEILTRNEFEQRSDKAATIIVRLGVPSVHAEGLVRALNAAEIPAELQILKGYSVPGLPEEVAEVTVYEKVL